MEKFENIHNTPVINESEVTLEKYIGALTDLKEAAKDPKHPLVTSRTIKTYYNNAINMGNESKFFDTKLRKQINKINKSFSKLGGEKDAKIVENNINTILKELTIDENAPIADVGSVNGMGAVSLPNICGGIGSGDVPGGSTASTQEPAETITMKKFDKIKEAKTDNEIYFSIKDLGDPATLIQTLTKELTKRTTAKESEVSKELTNIEISYNGLVDIKSIGKLATILDLDPKMLKKIIDKLINKNINLLENLQAELMKKILFDPEFLNEGIIGRTLGGIAGFAVGPKIGKIIAKVLGIEKGAFYNLLTSRIVSAALAQELSKNLI